MINELIKKATLSKDKVALNAYKNIKAEFEKYQHAQILERKLTPEIEQRIIFSYSKKLQDAIKQFSEAHRDDLVSEYTSELEVVKKLLPEPVNESEIFSELVNYCLQNNLAEEDEDCITWKISKKEMGNAIKYLKSKFPTADGKLISDIVKKYVM